MKNSTTKNSREKSKEIKKSKKGKEAKVELPKAKKVKGKFILGGLLFRPSEKFAKKHKVFNSLYEWVMAGAPNKVYIYDLIDTLNPSGIPIVDAVCLRGMYVKNKPGPLKECAVNTLHANPISLVDKDNIKKVPGILGADTKAHHQMNY